MVVSLDTSATNGCNNFHRVVEKLVTSLFPCSEASLALRNSCVTFKKSLNFKASMSIS